MDYWAQHTKRWIWIWTWICIWSWYLVNKLKTFGQGTSKSNLHGLWHVDSGLDWSNDSPAMLILISAFLARKSFPCCPSHGCIRFCNRPRNCLWYQVLQDGTMRRVISGSYEMRWAWFGGWCWYSVSGLIWSLIYHKSILSGITQIILMIFRKSSPSPYAVSLHSSLFSPLVNRDKGNQSIERGNPKDKAKERAKERAKGRKTKKEKEKNWPNRRFHPHIPNNRPNPPYNLQPTLNPHSTKFSIKRFKSRIRLQFRCCC